MSICGSYEFNRKGSWLLRPSKITVHLHDTVETKDIPKAETNALMERVHAIVSCACGCLSVGRENVNNPLLIPP
jgi:hypothetical protein